MNGPGWAARVLLGASAAMLTACASVNVPVNANDALQPPSSGPSRNTYSFAAWLAQHPAPMPDIVILSFSGGGARAAAFSAGVLHVLADDKVADKVALVSSTSGGSLTAAVFAAQGKDGVDSLTRDFLSKNHNLPLARQLAPSLLFGGENRAVGFGRYLDATVFGKKPDGRSTTYDDLIARWTPAAAPFVILNATDMSSGRNFEFTQAAFDDLCSDLGRFPLSQAVAASAAFPVLLNPVPLKNHWADRDCSAWVRGKRGQDQLRDAEDKKLSEPEQLGRARYVYSLRNAGNKDAKPEPDREIRFVHLLDGGLADNLGLRAVLRHLHDNYATLKDKGVRRILLVQVNARSATPSSYDLSADLPSAVDVFEAVAERPIDVTTEISSYLSRLYLLRLVTGSDAAVADRISIYPVDVDFELLDDRKTRLDAERIRTDWGLAGGKDTVDFLENAAATLMKANPCYQSFIARPPGPGVEGPRETCGFVQLLAQKTGNEGAGAPRPPPASVPPPPAPLPPPVAVGINFAMIVNFGAGSATLEPAAKARLDDLVTKLQQIKLDALIVTGFADAKERDAKRLSKSRAEAVKMYFALKGVDMKRVEIEARIGDGRRVEIEVVGKK